VVGVPTAQITHGPRAAALAASLSAALRALDAAPTDAERAAGWSDELCDAVRTELSLHVQDLTDRTDPLGRAAAGVDAIQPLEDDERLDAVLEPGVAILSLVTAEEALDATDSLIAALAAPPSRRDGDANEALRAAMVASLEAVGARLRAGAYLDGPEMADWVALLAANGVHRRGGAATVGPADPDLLAPGAGMISDYPKGRLWTQVCLCDAALVAVTLADVGWPPPASLTT
jgi:hypothetical protein